MPSMTIRNIPDEVRCALRARAARHGRSTEAEVRDILAQAARPEGRVELGSLLVAMGRDARLTSAEAEAFAELRDRAAAEPLGLK